MNALCRQYRGWLTLLLVAACLNPQPDRDPLARDNQSPAVSPNGNGSASTSPEPNAAMVPGFAGEDAENGATSSPPGTQPPPTGGISVASDAGSSPPSDAGVTESDAGVPGD